MTSLAARPTPVPAGSGLGLAARAWVAETLGDRENALTLVGALVDQAHTDPDPDGDTATVRAVVLLWCDMAGQAARVLGGRPAWLVVDEHDRTGLSWWSADLLVARAVGDHHRVDQVLGMMTEAGGPGAVMLAVLEAAATVFLHALAPQPPGVIGPADQ